MRFLWMMIRLVGATYGTCARCQTGANTRGRGWLSALTSGGLEYGDFALFQTSVQGLHKLQLDLVRSKRMVEILQLHGAGLFPQQISASFWKNRENGG